MFEPHNFVKRTQDLKPSYHDAGQFYIASAETWLNKINIFVNPNELFLTMLTNPKENLQGTLSLLERYNSLKRCRHLIESWGSQRLKTLENCISILIDNTSSGPSESNKEIDDLFKDLNSDAIKFQELYYLERQHMSFLDKQRCGNFIAS